MLFRVLLRFLGILLCFAGVNASAVIFPLYIYPDTNCAAWAPLFSSIQAFTQLTFYIVINPSSGPGTSRQPDANYKLCAAKMNAFENVITMGYIKTSNGGRSVSAVNSEIATYAGWTASYRPQGIFFDEADVPASGISAYAGFISTARSALGTNAFITLNPGRTPPAGFFSTGANLIVTVENFYSSFSTSQLVISASTPASQQVVLLHDAPSITPLNFVQDLIGQGIAALFITSSPQALAYEQIPADWSNFLGEVAASS